MGPSADAGERAADKVVDHGHSLGGTAQTDVRQQDVVVDQGRSVADLNEYVLGHHAARQEFRVRRTLVVMQQVLRNACALGFPVAPDTHRAVVDVVAAYSDVNGRMQLDTGDLRSAELRHVVDVVYVVVLNDAEH